MLILLDTKFYTTEQPVKTSLQPKNGVFKAVAQVPETYCCTMSTRPTGGVIVVTQIEGVSSQNKTCIHVIKDSLIHIQITLNNRTLFI